MPGLNIESDRMVGWVCISASVGLESNGIAALWSGTVCASIFEDFLWCFYILGHMLQIKTLFLLHLPSPCPSCWTALARVLSTRLLN